MFSQNILYYGNPKPLPERVPLCAGPLSLIYEAGDLRYIKLDAQEILRRIYVAVRDQIWGTVPPLLSNVRLDIGDDSFRITYDVEHKQGDIDFAWRGAITGDAQGTITFAMDGIARSTFLRNRIGFCVLHPMRECAGQPCTVEKANGTVEHGRFPKFISPHQPFVDMRAISHQVVPGVRAEVRFSGDVFEMEDQRNWTDASYKTYCTPLALPFPVQMEEGTEITQSVTLNLRRDAPPKRVAPLPPAELIFTIGQSPLGSLPRIGLGTASHGQPLSTRDLARLKELNLSHLRVDLELSRPEYESALRQAAVEASALDVPLEVALLLSDAATDEIEALAASIEAIEPAVCTWLIFHKAQGATRTEWFDLVREYLAACDPAPKIGGGTNAYFTHLNRVRPPMEALDIVSYSLNPQVHAFDNGSLVEALETQATTIESARQFVGALPLAISPITLKPRFNPTATGPELDPPPGELPAQVDVRQMSLFGAAWTTGSLKYVSEGGAYSVTYYETSGWRGVMEMEAGSRLPDAFRSWPGSVFPLYHILADVGEFAGGDVIPTASSDTLRADGLAVHKDGQTRVLLANLCAEAQQVTIKNLGKQVQVRHLDESNVEEAMMSPERFRTQATEHLETHGRAARLTLLPYAIVRLDAV